MRNPSWAGGTGHVPMPTEGLLQLPVVAQWWETDARVEGAGSSVYLRSGPVVHCVEGVDLPGLDLRDLTVDPDQAPARAFSVRKAGGDLALYRPVDTRGGEHAREPCQVITVPYHAWANRGLSTMRMRFARH